MAAHSLQACALMRIPTKDATSNTSVLACSQSGMLRLRSMSHSRVPRDQLCLRGLGYSKVVPWERSNVRRMCTTAGQFNDTMEMTDGCFRMQKCYDATGAGECATDAMRKVSIVREASEGYLPSGFRYALFCTSHQPASVLFLRIGYDPDILKTSALLQTMRRMPSSRSTGDVLFRFTSETIPGLCSRHLKICSQGGLEVLGTSRVAFVCLFLEFVLAPTAFLVSFLFIPLIVGMVCALLGALFALLPATVWLIRVLWKVSFKRTSVVKFQVGLMGRIDTLDLEVKQLLNAFAGPQQMLTDAVVALLRYSDSIIAADYSLFTHSNAESIEERFMYLSLEERGMRDESWEELHPLRLGYRTSQPESVSDDYRLSHLVVTLVVVAKGHRKLPSMKDAKDIEENLKKLGCIPADAIQTVGVYCTPFSDQFKMSIKYPNLKYY